jgi:excisionase family DNA binding protein
MKRISAPAKPAPALADEIMTVSGLALYLQCHVSTVYRLLNERKIPAFKLGDDWRFQRSDIDEWVRARQVTPEDAGEDEDKPKSRPPKPRRRPRPSPVKTWRSPRCFADWR